MSCKIIFNEFSPLYGEKNCVALFQTTAPSEARKFRRGALIMADWHDDWRKVAGSNPQGLTKRCAMCEILWKTESNEFWIFLMKLICRSRAQYLSKVSDKINPLDFRFVDRLLKLIVFDDIFRKALENYYFKNDFIIISWSFSTPGPDFSKNTRKLLF